MKLEWCTASRAAIGASALSGGAKTRTGDTFETSRNRAPRRLLQNSGTGAASFPTK